MELSEQMKEEIKRIFEQLGKLDPKSEEYSKVISQLKILQECLCSETKRANSIIELQQKDKQIRQEGDRIELEVEKFEFEKEKNKHELENMQIRFSLDEKKFLLETRKVAADELNANTQKFIADIEAKYRRRDKIFMIALEVIKGLIFAGANLTLVFGSIMANNSGEYLPPMVTKLISGKKF